MLYLIVFLSFFTVFLMFLGILYVINRDKLRIQDRMEKVRDINIYNPLTTPKMSFSERALMPFYQSLTRLSLKFTPKYKVNQLNLKLERAGLLKKTTAEQWMLNKSIFTFIITILLIFLLYIIEADILSVIIIVTLFILFINTILRFYLSSKISNRKNQITRDLPFTLDLITVSVEAGLSFDGAIARVINNIKGELSDEFGKVLKEIRMGIERKMALRNMSERCEVKELSTLVTSIIQADELGVSLGKILRIESSQLREHRKQAAREKAMKAPVKMLFPLMFFVFPAIFIIILGPAIIKIIDIF